MALLHLLLLLQLVRQLPMEPLVRLCRLLTEVQQLLLQLVVLPQRLPAALLLLLQPAALLLQLQPAALLQRLLAVQ